ncbi:aminotransferase class V-fold PLP-dependent enzyme [Rhodovulum sp. 12E13]|uniref:aminotransferase class V-fold PLP-dependent enzyme n=1 Tax=Rhodovulum sp. 12E13 TaxID=2203891 RepID=UPI000E18F1A7|nr:aminotransferase class V-fold PLP-dependent enzyme [Rhodovulum sp. 12E13]RDC73491.1 aminotransferase class V-fold PLP-dependent enzyme [Rhodovulum sp. 12E13]
MRLSPEFVRGQFPAFSEPSLRDWAHFENAGGSFACRYVIWRLHRFYRERNVQPCGDYPASERAGEEMDEARRRLALVLGVEAEEVSFGPSTTQNAFILAAAFRDWLRPGEAVVVTEQDHEANSAPWRRLAQAGVEVREWRIDPETGHLDDDDLADLMDDGKVRLVCFPHCSNVVGEINDARRICAMVRRAGAYSCVDGVSYAPHGLPDIGRIGADIYLFSTYKTYGPHQGIMVIRRSLGMRLPNQAFDFNGDELWKRFTPAGPDHAQIAACAGIVDYIDALYHHHTKAGRDVAGRAVAIAEAMRSRELALMGPLVDYLAGRAREVRLLGPMRARDRAPTFALDLGRPAEPVARRLARHGIMAGAGEFYAPRPLAAMGVPPGQGVLRLSFLHYTLEQDVDRLIAALDAEI